MKHAYATEGLHGRPALLRLRATGANVRFGSAWRPRWPVLTLSVALASSALSQTPVTERSRSPMAAIGPGQVRLTYLGNAGWEITDGRTVIIVDPFVTQFASYPPSGKGAPRSRDDLLIPDSASIDRHVPRADALIGAIKPRDGTDDIYDYMGRLMRVLGQPKTVLPTHLDAYGDPTEQKAVEVARRVFAEEVRRLSPKTRVIIPTWFEAIVLGSAR